MSEVEHLRGEQRGVEVGEHAGGDGPRVSRVAGEVEGLEVGDG